MSSERFHQNAARVYEIYGIPPEQRGIVYNIHHIVNKADVGSLVRYDFDIDGKSNLFPMLIGEHCELHRKQQHDEAGGEHKRLKRERLKRINLTSPDKSLEVSRRIRKQELKSTVNRYNLDALDINADLHFRKISNKAGKRKNSRHRK
jgi:hypothetical protein